MEFGNRQMGRGMGSVMKVNNGAIVGTAKDIETIIRLRSWMEDEGKKMYGDFSKSHLFTDYDSENDIFKFKIILES